MKPWKILVPYDGSKQSDKALKKAIELTELIDKGGTRIEINMLHVVAEIYVPPTLFDRDVNVKSKITGERLTSEQYLKEFYHEMKSKAMKMLETKKSKELESPNIMVRNYVTHGYPSDKILEFANKHQSNSYRKCWIDWFFKDQSLGQRCTKHLRKSELSCDVSSLVQLIA
jgi:nucleotide-binding universal stress UspA family protein